VQRTETEKPNPPDGRRNFQSAREGSKTTSPTATRKHRAARDFACLFFAFPDILNVVDTFPDATVLVVDDTLENLSAVGCFMEGLCPVVAAENGEEALELALKLQPDVILLDVLMPGLSGIDVLKQLQSNPATKSIAVLLVTSLGDPESKLEGFACGAVDFVTKPFLAGELRARVATQLRIRQLEHQLRQQIRSLNQELTEGRQHFDFLAEHTAACLLCADAWDRVILVNPAWFHLTGKEPDSILGQLFFHLFVEEDQPAVRKEIQRAIEARHTHVHFLARLTAKGASRMVHVDAAFPRTTHSTSCRWCAVMTDVTEVVHEMQDWKTAHETLRGKYAACWEDLQRSCQGLTEKLHAFNSHLDKGDLVAAKDNTGDMQKGLALALGLARANEELLQAVSEKLSPGDFVSAMDTPRASSQERAHSGGRQPSCLVLDSSPVQARVLGILLSECGIGEIRMVTDAGSAEAEIAQNPPDVFVFDLLASVDPAKKHPAKILREREKQQSLILGLSAPGVGRGRKHGEDFCDGILWRPVSLSAVREALAGLAARSTPPARPA
jgi:PAS domain S-box-containing protein